MKLWCGSCIAAVQRDLQNSSAHRKGVYSNCMRVEGSGVTQLFSHTHHGPSGQQEHKHTEERQTHQKNLPPTGGKHRYPGHTRSSLFLLHLANLESFQKEFHCTYANFNYMLFMCCFNDFRKYLSPHKTAETPSNQPVDGAAAKSRCPL